jgi:hypothetical protein
MCIQSYSFREGREALDPMLACTQCDGQKTCITNKEPPFRFMRIRDITSPATLWVDALCVSLRVDALCINQSCEIDSLSWLPVKQPSVTRSPSFCAYQYLLWYTRKETTINFVGA